MNTASRSAISFVLSLFAAGPAGAQTGLVWAMDTAIRLGAPKNNALDNVPVDPYMANDLADGLALALKLDHNSRVVLIDPLTGRTPGSNSTDSTRFCVRLFEGDSRGTIDTGRDGVIGYSAVLADDPPAAAPAKPEEKPKAAPPSAPPTLDELLGIKPAAPAVTEKPAAGKPEEPKAADGSTPDPSKSDLNRLLTAQEIGDAFKQAVALMGDASSRLVDHKDPGLDTQRVQEDALKRLDQLISSLQKQQQQQQQQQSPSQKQQDPKDGPPKQGQQASKSPQEAKGGDGQRKDLGPTLQQGALNPQLESARAAWGSLPARVREMLMQGTEDRFSSRYKALTQEYYKRLAEENSK